MKRNLLFIITGLLACQMVHAQLSYSELRLRDKTLNDGIAYILEEELELGAASVWSCLDMDSTFAPAWLLKGQILLEWGALEDAREALKQAFSRAAILSNEKFRGVRLTLSENLLQITANNPEREEAEEYIDVNYQAENLEIGFNVSYVLDVLNTLKSDQVKMTFSSSDHSALIESVDNDDSLYVLMPMRL